MDDPHFSGPSADRPRWTTDSGVAIIGGMGEMGRLFSSFFKDLGFHVGKVAAGPLTG